MGTREVYEEKMRSGNLHHDPTMNLGLGSSRCLSLLFPNFGRGEWTITSVLREATVVAGSGIGGMLSAVNGFNTGIPYLQNRLEGPKWLPFLYIIVVIFSLNFISGIPYLQNRLEGPKWLPFLVGLPPLLAVSGASAVFGGYMLPKFAQLTVTSYYAASSASHYGISLLTRHIEEGHVSQTRDKRLR